jgi:hypothetical protein
MREKGKEKRKGMREKGKEKRKGFKRWQNINLLMYSKGRKYYMAKERSI